jgi:hypothetical protein
MLAEMIRMFRPFVDSQRRLMMITSWNEWHEDTQIEPVVDAPPTAVDESSAGDNHTAGYAYEGYGLKPLRVVADLLASELAVGIEREIAVPKDAKSAVFIYPNPAAGHALFEFGLGNRSEVELAVFDVMGRRVATLERGRAGPGRVMKKWVTLDVTPGLYFCRLVIDGSDTVHPIIVQ